MNIGTNLGHFRPRFQHVFFAVERLEFSRQKVNIFFLNIISASVTLARYWYWKQVKNFTTIFVGRNCYCFSNYLYHRETKNDSRISTSRVQQHELSVVKWSAPSFLPVITLNPQQPKAGSSPLHPGYLHCCDRWTLARAFRQVEGGGGEKTAVGLASPGNEASRRIRNSSAGKRLSAKRLTASVRTFAARALHAIVTFLPLVLIYTFSLVLGFARAHYLDFLVCLHCLCRERLHQRFEKSQFWSYLKNLILWKYNRIVVMFFLDIMKVSINFCKVRIKLSFCTDRNLYSCKPYRQRMFLYFFYQNIKYQVIPIFVHRH